LCRYSAVLADVEGAVAAWGRAEAEKAPPVRASLHSRVSD
jgi:hypothetical protein